jgi:hypothetical protein
MEMNFDTCANVMKIDTCVMCVTPFDTCAYAMHLDTCVNVCNEF